MTVRLIGSDQGPAATAASGINSHAEGANTTASGNYAHAEGSAAKATGANSHAEGNTTTASAPGSHAGGNYATADAIGAWARGTMTPGNVYGARVQYGTYAMAAATTSTAGTVLTMDANSTVNYTPGTANVLVIPLYSNYVFQLMLTVRRIGGGAVSNGWHFSGMVARDNGNARLVGSPTQLATWTDGTSLGTVAIAVNATFSYLTVTVSPSSATATSWHGVLTTNELSTTS